MGSNFDDIKKLVADKIGELASFPKLPERTPQNMDTLAKQGIDATLIRWQGIS